MKNKIMYSYGIVALSMFLVSSCTKQKGYLDSTLFSIEDFGEPIPLKGREVIFDEILMKPVKITLIDSFLLMKNINTEQCIHLFNLNSRKKVGERITFGTGPDEMIDPRIIGLYNNKVWILDKNRYVLNEYNSNCFFLGDSLKVDKKISFPDFCNSVVPLSGKGFVSLTFNQKDKRLLFMNTIGKEPYLKGEYPMVENLASPMEKIEGFIGDIVTSLLGDRIVVTYKRTDLIDIYDKEGNLLRRMHGPDHFLPEIHQDGERIGSNPGQQDREAYFWPLAVGEHFFVLYSGKESKRGDYLINKIFVFDWDGDPVTYYSLDTSIFDFAVDSKKKKIYGLTDSPESHIVEFNY